MFCMVWFVLFWVGLADLVMFMDSCLLLAYLGCLCVDVGMYCFASCCVCILLFTCFAGLG